MSCSGVTIVGLEPLFSRDVRLVVGEPGGAPTALSVTNSDSKKEQQEDANCSGQTAHQNTNTAAEVGIL